MGNGDKNVAVELLNQGLAWMDERSASRSAYYAQMEAANNAAKEARRGVWEHYDEKAEQEAAAAAAANQRQMPEVVHISVQHVTNGTTFWMHALQDEGKRMLDSRAAQFAMGDFGPPGVGGRYRKDQYCLASFVDGQVYRAKVLEARPNDKYLVIYIDYGNQHEVSVDDMQQFPGDNEYMRPEMAWKCKLAYVQAPEIGAEYGDEAAHNLELALMDREDLLVHIVKWDAHDGLLHVIVYEQQHQSPGDSINCRMLETGCVRTASSRQMGPVPADLLEAEQIASKRHLALWRYGDSRADSDEEERRPRRWNQVAK